MSGRQFVSKLTNVSIIQYLNILYLLKDHVNFIGLNNIDFQNYFANVHS